MWATVQKATLFLQTKKEKLQFYNRFHNHLPFPSNLLADVTISGSSNHKDFVAILVCFLSSFHSVDHALDVQSIEGEQI